mgnify:CR=1 FL=1
MKKLLIIFLTIGLLSCSSKPKNYTEVPWATMENIESLVQKEPRKTIVDVYTPWCGPCKMMDKNTFSNPEVINQIGKNFYAVKFNAEGNDELTFSGKAFSNPNYKPEMAKRRNSPHQLTRYFKVTAYPSMVFIDEDLKPNITEDTITKYSFKDIDFPSINELTKQQYSFIDFSACISKRNL